MGSGNLQVDVKHCGLLGTPKRASGSKTVRRYRIFGNQKHYSCGTWVLTLYIKLHEIWSITDAQLQVFSIRFHGTSRSDLDTLVKKVLPHVTHSENLCVISGSVTSLSRVTASWTSLANKSHTVPEPRNPPVLSHTPPPPKSAFSSLGSSDDEFIWANFTMM